MKVKDRIKVQGPSNRLYFPLSTTWHRGDSFKHNREKFSSIISTETCYDIRSDVRVLFIGMSEVKC